MEEKQGYLFFIPREAEVGVNAPASSFETPCNARLGELIELDGIHGGGGGRRDPPLVTQCSNRTRNRERSQPRSDGVEF